MHREGVDHTTRDSGTFVISSVLGTLWPRVFNYDTVQLRQHCLWNLQRCAVAQGGRDHRYERPGNSQFWSSHVPDGRGVWHQGHDPGTGAQSKRQSSYKRTAARVSPMGSNLMVVTEFLPLTVPMERASKLVIARFVELNWDVAMDGITGTTSSRNCLQVRKL